ncbi:MAG: NAD-dependent succinate-semialdehyde dehydrogenase [Candidatus Rokuibacteriota bacterium]
MARQSSVSPSFLGRRPAIASVNPATGETLRVFEPLRPSDIEARIARAAQAYRPWRRTPFAERARLLKHVADILDEQRAAFGRVMTTEMGKPLKAAIDEVARCAWGCRYYAEHAAALLADEPAPVEGAKAFVRYEPLGPILAVMPWNFPFWQVFRFAAPALMAGNVGLLKHAANVPQCALAIEHIFRQAEFPEGVFQTLLVTTDQVGGIIADDRVVAVTLTGSERAGSEVARQAAARIKKSVLELGGSDPFIVMPSADLEDAVRTAVRARVVNNGQSCIAAKRFIVAEPVADEFERRFVEAMRRLRVGDPLDPSTDVGPLATEEILAGLDAQVRRSVAAGARVLTGGQRLERPGNYYAPTVLTDVPRGAPARTEELFGPVATLLRARDVEAAIDLANETTFGLGCSVWTQDRAEREHFIGNLEAGVVFVNAMVASDPRVPFGGVKRSGYGRELGVHGLREFVNVKTVWIQAAPAPGQTTE